jgi:hypothetical protein
MEALVLWAATHPEEIKQWGRDLSRQMKRLMDVYTTPDEGADWDMDLIEDVVVVSAAISTVEVVQ